MCVRISYRYADNDHGYTGIAEVNCRSVCRTAASDCILHRDPQFFSQVQCVTLISWIRDHSGVNVAEHWSVFDGGLNHVRLDDRIIGGTALENNGDIGFDDIRGDRCSADTYFT